LVSNVWLSQARSISGHVFRVDRVGGPVWFAKYRRPDGRQVEKIAPAWTKPGRPDDGFVNRRGAEACLCDVLAQAHAGTLPGMVRTGVVFSRRGGVVAVLRRGPGVQAVDDGGLPASHQSRPHP
jgi:hypothetical protein